MHKQGFQDDINSTRVFCKFREIVIYQIYMNLETILSDTYYIQIHKLTTIECLTTVIMNWHRTLKCPAKDLSLSRLIGIYPHVTGHWDTIYLINLHITVAFWSQQHVWHLYIKQQMRKEPWFFKSFSINKINELVVTSNRTMPWLRRLVTAETRLRTWVNPREIYCGQSGTETGFSSVFPCQYHTTVTLQTHIIWGMNNMSVSGRN
jgi:hypothetical protein